MSLSERDFSLSVGLRVCGCVGVWVYRCRYFYSTTPRFYLTRDPYYRCLTSILVRHGFFCISLQPLTI